jgi:hypothetical protein
MKNQVLCVAVLLTGLSGCADSRPVRMDLTSESTYEASLKAMQSSLSREEQANLMVALLRIRMSGISSAKDAQVSVGGGLVLSAEKMTKIDGLTYSEILDLASQSGVKTEILR